jgi:DNA mismatch repair protein MutS2
VQSAIGDAQDLSKDLSTFSAHLTALREIGRSAGTGSLVLIDEIAADTDPREGAAIALAVLEDLVAKGARCIVTTHLDELKAVAVTDPRYVTRPWASTPRRWRPPTSCTWAPGLVVGDRDRPRWGWTRRSATRPRRT